MFENTLPNPQSNAKEDINLKWRWNLTFRRLTKDKWVTIFNSHPFFKDALINKIPALPVILCLESAIHNIFWRMKKNEATQNVPAEIESFLKNLEAGVKNVKTELANVSVQNRIYIALPKLEVIDHSAMLPGYREAKSVFYAAITKHEATYEAIAKLYKALHDYTKTDGALYRIFEYDTEATSTLELPITDGGEPHKVFFITDAKFEALNIRNNGIYVEISWNDGSREALIFNSHIDAFKHIFKRDATSNDDLLAGLLASGIARFPYMAYLPPNDDMKGRIDTIIQQGKNISALSVLQPCVANTQNSNDLNVAPNSDITSAPIESNLNTTSTPIESVPFSI